MELKFKNQKYQMDAAMAVVKCFDGQQNLGLSKKLLKRGTGQMTIENSEDNFYSFGNKRIKLPPETIRENIRSVQRENNLEYTDKENVCNYAIEMETGTGKTYTYIKTMYELNKYYGWSKFIVITPSIAIREGVLKSFQITQNHFQSIYKKKVRYFVYNSNNSSNLSNIRGFVSDNNLNVIIMNYQAFNTRSKNNRKIYEELDELNSEKPIDLIKSTNPILIIDEPQKMGKTEEKLDEFNPLFILRYSATHKKEYNMIYRLDAIDAYNQKLVKRINVKGIEILNDKSKGAYLNLESIEISKSAPVAKIEIEMKTNTGTKKVTRTLSKDDNLYELSGKLAQYEGYRISDINYNDDKVSFTNGQEIYLGKIVGSVAEDYITRIQIRETIRTHFEKERIYNKKGIKVLSLFFIDEVKKYKEYDENKKSHNGEYARIFEEEYERQYKENYDTLDDEYRKYLDSLKGKKVHSGYFSVDKNASKGLSYEEAVYTDYINASDKKSDSSSDENAYDLIMKDKERLLSLEEPVRFIFSHSALREGWDNPNIFQICTLKKSNSYISKRQEIGRGLRICVNNEGDRMDYETLEGEFFEINNLTVIASESYEEFSKSLQKEILDELYRKSYSIFKIEHFKDKCISSDGGIKELGDRDCQIIKESFVRNGYIDDDNNITEKLKEDIKNHRIEIPEQFIEFGDSYAKLVSELYSDKEYKIEKKKTVQSLKPNDNFDKKEFQDLWNKINVKTMYEVDFNSDELIGEAVKRINEKLELQRPLFSITTGSQSDNITIEGLKSGTTMRKENKKTEIYNDDDIIYTDTKYDLVGEIVEETSLTRHTVATILMKISPQKFEFYKYSPQEFINKVSNLIKEEKATTIIDGITYNKTTEKYDNEIFTINNLGGKYEEGLQKLKKHIYDYLLVDSKTEQKFANELEQGEVTIYAKLPKEFKIPTPMGNYNPDWAIVLENENFKYVYFIAETKGSMREYDLRGNEEAKIKCARKHFEAICKDDVKYAVVESYDDLIKELTSKV